MRILRRDYSKSIKQLKHVCVLENFYELSRMFQISPATAQKSGLKLVETKTKNISCWLAIGETVTLVAVNERVNWVWCGVNMSVGGLAVGGKERVAIL